MFEYFDFKKEILALEKAELLREVITSFKAVDLHPDVVSNADMGDAFEYIIRKFNEAANETSGDHYTPRDAIRLLVDLLFAEKDVDLTEAGIVRTLYDPPTAGTGGMLALAEEHLLEQNPPDAKLSLYGQEYNGQSYAICKSDLLAKGHDATNIGFGNTLTEDAFKDRKFDFCMSNPPYGVDWKQYAKAVTKERDEAGPTAGSPRACRRPRTADAVPAPSGPQDARPQGRRRPCRHRHERLTALQRRRRVRPLEHPQVAAGERPGRGDRRAADQHVLQHRHRHLHLDPRQHQASGPQGPGTAHRRHLVLDQDAQEPRCQEPRAQRHRPRRGREVVRRLHRRDPDYSKVLRNHEFGYWTITVERPLLDEGGKPVVDRKGKPKPDSKKRDTENVPPFTYGGSTAGATAKTEVIQAYFDAEVKPHVPPDAWIDWTKVKTGYEIPPFTRHFYKYVPPPRPPLAEIDADLEKQVAKILDLLREVEQ